MTRSHWVKNGPEVSVSFSITPRTDFSDRREIRYHVNHQLHQLKLPVSPVSRSRLADDAKFRAFRMLRRGARLLRGWRESCGRSYQ